MSGDREEQIRRRAHELWEQSGRPERRETEFWLQAERELSQDEVFQEEQPKR